MSVLDEKLEHFAALQKELLDKNQELTNLKERYKAETKEVFGVADGEPINIMEVVSMIKRVADMMK